MLVKKIGLGLLLALAAAGGTTGYFYYKGQSRDDPHIIRVSGNIEVTDAEVSFKLPGIVAQRPVDEGQLIPKGTLIALLEDSELRSEVDIRRAELQAAHYGLAELEAGSRPGEIAAARAAVQKSEELLRELVSGSRPQEVAAAEARLATSKAERTHAEGDFNRAQRLIRQKVISSEEYERAQKTYEVAAARAREAGEQLKLLQEGPRKEQIEQARAALAEARARFSLVKEGPRKEQIDLARARVEQAKAVVGLAKTRLGYAKLVSPLSGIVLSKNVEPGEYVAPGTPVVTVGDLERVWLRAYINETDLGRVKVGQRVRVTTDTYRDKAYEGRISFISSESEFTPKNVQTEKERVKLVYRIKVEIPNPAMELKPGMPADADILLGSPGEDGG